MKIETLVVGALQVNCYIVSDGDSPDCMIVDPGGTARAIIEAVEGARLRPRWIVNTHGHGDHIGANAQLKERYPDAKLAVHRLDAPALTDARLNLSVLLGQPIYSPEADKELEEGDEIEVGSLRFRVAHTPGHSVGGVCLIADGAPPVAIVGDALFAGSVGRTDFPGGDGAQLIRSIKDKLLVLPDETRVLTGHGPETTIGSEKRRNPFL